MNRIKLLVLAAALPLGVMAQSGPLTASRFEAEGNSIYLVSGAVPGSDVCFYAQKKIATHTGTAVADANGEARIVADSSRGPAFVLNSANIGRTGVAGSGKVMHFNGPIFRLEPVTISHLGHTATLAWKAQANEEGMEFVVRKSEDGQVFTVVAIMAFPQSGGALPYTFSENLTVDVAYYTVEVSRKKEPLYTTSVKGIGTDGHLSVYPTLSRGTLNVVIDERDKGAAYRIMSADGKVVRSGNIESVTASISTVDLAAANYTLELISAGKRYQRKFVKL